MAKATRAALYSAAKEVYRPWPAPATTCSAIAQQRGGRRAGHLQRGRAVGVALDHQRRDLDRGDLLAQVGRRDRHVRRQQHRQRRGEDRCLGPCRLQRPAVLARRPVAVAVRRRSSRRCRRPSPPGWRRTPRPARPSALSGPIVRHGVIGALSTRRATRGEPSPPTAWATTAPPIDCPTRVTSRRSSSSSTAMTSAAIVSRS